MTTFTNLGQTEDSIAIRVTEEDGTFNDYGVFNIVRKVCNNSEAVDTDPEHIEPTYDEESQPDFTEFFSDISTDEKFNSACKAYLTARQGYTF